MQEYVSVIGGSNLDVKGEPYDVLKMGTSNPGRIVLSPGGVGRNIAHNLALLGVPVHLLSAVGDDLFGREILESARQAGVCVDAVRIVQKQRSGLYLSLLDHQHEMAVAVSDMKIVRQVDRVYLAKHTDSIRASRFVVLEANLESDVLQFAANLCRKAQVPFLVEPVSVEKAKRLQYIPGQIDFLTPNMLELEALAVSSHANMLPTSQESLEKLCTDVGKRCRSLLVTHGKEGIFYYQDATRTGEWYRPKSVDVVDANGAGDAFVAGFVSGIFFRYPIERCIRLGMAVAYLALQSPETVNPAISLKQCLSMVESE